MELFGSELELLKIEWTEKIRPTIASKTADTVERLQAEQFSAVSDVIRTAARIPQDRTLTPDRVQAVCSYGLEKIFAAR